MKPQGALHRDDELTQVLLLLEMNKTKGTIKNYFKLSDHLIWTALVIHKYILSTP